MILNMQQVEVQRTKLASIIITQSNDDDVEVFIRLYSLLYYADATFGLAESVNELKVALNAVK